MSFDFADQLTLKQPSFPCNVKEVYKIQLISYFKVSMLFKMLEPFRMKKHNITLMTGNGQTDTQTQYCCSFYVVV